MTLNFTALHTAPTFALDLALRDYFRGLAGTISAGLAPTRSLDHWAGPILTAIRRLNAERATRS